MKRKVVINRTCGTTFGLSEKGLDMYKSLSGIEDDDLYDFDIDRHDPNLVKVIETLGKEASWDGNSELTIVELPEGEDKYMISEDESGIEDIYTPSTAPWINID